VSLFDLCGQVLHHIFDPVRGEDGMIFDQFIHRTLKTALGIEEAPFKPQRLPVLPDPSPVTFC
jgi:hypothetical protein